MDVLRHGVRDQNVEIRLSYRKPAFGVAPELVAHYDANRLTVTRQLAYDPESGKTVDLCLFVNGIPVATAELKNHLTGRTSSMRSSSTEPTAIRRTSRWDGGRWSTSP